MKTKTKKRMKRAAIAAATLLPLVAVAGGAPMGGFRPPPQKPIPAKPPK